MLVQVGKGCQGFSSFTYFQFQNFFSQTRSKQIKKIPKVKAYYNSRGGHPCHDSRHRVIDVKAKNRCVTRCREFVENDSLSGPVT